MEAKFVYDNYQISGCYRIDEAGQKDPAGPTVVRCDDAHARFWTIDGLIDGRIVGAIGQFASREAAADVYRRIIGEPFLGSGQAGRRLRLMQASPLLLAACEQVVERWEHGDLADAARACSEAVREATTACPPWVSGEIDIDAVLKTRQQIASIWGIEDVQEIRPDLDDRQAWQVLRQARHDHDATIGINWEVLSCQAELLFGDAPETDDEEE